MKYYSTITLHHLPILKPNPVEENRWKGFMRPVHQPLPRGAVDVMSSASTHPPDYRVRLMHRLLLVMARKSTRLMITCYRQTQERHSNIAKPYLKNTPPQRATHFTINEQIEKKIHILGEKNGVSLHAS
jgi:hypothetical protein